MPYPRATYYMLAVIGVIVIGFWPSYFALGPTTVPWQFHAHGVAASLWVMMVTAQSWTAQHKNQLQLHRAIGKTSLFLFPFLIAGLAAITSLQSKNFVAGDAVHLLYGPGFMIGTMVAMAAYVTVFYRALKYRRKVWVHSGYMLSTPLILFESPFSRAASFVFPPFHVNGPAEFYKIMASIEWSCVIELAIIGIIWWRVGEKAKPFLVTAGLIVLEMLAMGFASDFAILKQFDTFMGHIPSVTIVLIGFAIGAATSYLGWQAGKQPAPAGKGAPQPA
ncbi:MAG TPA: hypothetical protein VF098_11650 [Sphingomicrobium sp.]|jgi:hypothetical protein